jgi:prefoldin subunit 5
MSEKRQTRTAAERAQEALDVADRKIDRLSSAKAKAEATAAEIGRELDALRKRRDYLAQNPDLPSETREQVVTSASSIAPTEG